MITKHKVFIRAPWGNKAFLPEENESHPLKNYTITNLLSHNNISSLYGMWGKSVRRRWCRNWSMERTRDDKYSGKRCGAQQFAADKLAFSPIVVTSFTKLKKTVKKYFYNHFKNLKLTKHITNIWTKATGKTKIDGLWKVLPARKFESYPFVSCASQRVKVSTFQFSIKYIFKLFLQLLQYLNHMESLFLLFRVGRLLDRVDSKNSAAVLVRADSPRRDRGI